jgi:predicted Rossmann fold flavoprotein
MKEFDLIVIGGGAAGFFSAVNVAAQNPAARIAIVDRASKFLSKVKISGGGRCNVTHHCFDVQELIKFYPRGSKQLQQAFNRFQPKDTVEWFNKHGVKLVTESDGRMFPSTNSSQTIVDCLMDEAEKYGVRLMPGCGIKTVTKEGTRFLLHTDKEETLSSKNVLLACGGFPKKSQYDFIASLNIAIVDPVPSLFTFIVKDKSLTELAGIAVPKATVKQAGSKKIYEGPVLITHQGLSGPAILKTSAFAARELFERNYAFTLLVNWIPQNNQEQTLQELQQLKQQESKKIIPNARLFCLPERLWLYFIEKAGIAFDTRWADVSNKQLNQLTNLISAFEVQVTGKNTFKDEFVTAGGVDLNEVDFTSMQSKKVSGLYFAGEVLDIDGVTGGFNFQAAWTTGWIAAQHIMTNISHKS